jgi:tRNA modification GTPase
MRSTPSTICAIATAPGPGSISVIRVSGPETFAVLDRVFHGSRPSRQRSHTVRLGWLKDSRGRRIDRVMLAVFRAPRSYTGEHMAEISCHGGPYVADAVVRELVHQGCRSARPGEFTRRAVLAGKLALSQAEAILDIVNAQSARAHEDALARYSGSLSGFIPRLRAGLDDLVAEAEFHLGFDERDEHRLFDPAPRLLKLKRETERALDLAAKGRLLHEGARVAIVGRPNTGKSSLFNRLLEEDRAIVSPLRGTTRDRVEAWTVFSGIPARLADTAGIGSRGTDGISRLAAAQTRRAIEHADLVLAVFDGSEPARRSDRSVVESASGRPTLVVVNKIDRPRRLRPDFARDIAPRAASVSCRTGQGIGHLRALIGRRLRPAAASGVALSRSELDGLRSCRDALDRSLAAPSAEAAALEIRTAGDMLSQLESPVPSEGILDRVFARFCVGK